MADKPEFDPSQPFEEPKPAFDPDKPFSASGTVPVKSGLQLTLENIPESAESAAIGTAQTAFTAAKALVDPNPIHKMQTVYDLAKGFVSSEVEKYRHGLGEAIETDPVGVALDAITVASLGAGGIREVKGTIKSFTPFNGQNDADVKSFDDANTVPAARRLDSFARTGDPNGVRLDPVDPGVKPSPITPVQGSDFAGVPRSIAAKTGIPEVDMVLMHPLTRALIDNPVIDRAHDVPYGAGGSVPLERPTVNIDRHVPPTMTVGKVTFDPAEPAAVHENIEQTVMEFLKKNGWKDDEAYRVAHFGWAEPAEDAWYSAHGIDPKLAEAEWNKILPKIQHENPENPPPDLYKDPYPHRSVAGAQHESVQETPPTPDELQRARDLVRNAPEFQPKSMVPMLEQARSLGVTMPQPEALPGDSATAAAIKETPPLRAVGAAVTPPEMLAMMPDGKTPIGDYERRFKEWIPKIDQPDDVKDLIARVAEQNEYFGEARAGQIPLAHVEQVAKAAGVDPESIDRGLLTTTFNRPGAVRAIIATLKATSRAALEAGQVVADSPTLENAQKALEAEERHRYVMEYALGQRAESGKSLAAWKDLLVQQQRSDAVKKIRADEGTGKSKEGLGDLIEAAGDFKDNINNPPKEGELGLVKLIKAAERAVKPAEPKEGKPPAPIPEELKGVIGEANKVLRRLKTGDKTPEQFYRLIKQAENQVRDALKNAPANGVRKPADILSPDLQALIDKADRVAKRLGQGDPEANMEAFLQSRGRTLQDQTEIGQSMRGMTDEQGAQLLRRMKDEGEKPGWFYWMVQQSLISGLVTHTKYLFVNTAQTELDRVISPIVAETLSGLRGNKPNYGPALIAQADLIRAVPKALTGFGQAFRSGLRVPLESELRLYRRGEESPQSKGAAVPYGQQGGPDWGIWKKVFNETQLDKATKWLGTPGRSANGIHTFYKILNEQAALSSKAYEETLKELGYGPLTNNTKFWDRFQHNYENPTDDVLRDAVNDGYEGTFMEKLGKAGIAFQRAARNIPGVRWVFMFTHIPVDIAARAIEYSPLAPVNQAIWKSVKGENGAAAQNLALAKMTVGTAVGAYFIDQAMQGKATGDYPIDENEKKRWKVMGIQPNSIQGTDGQWHSMDRLGPPGLVASVAANWAYTIQHYEISDHSEKEMTKAAAGLIFGTVGALMNDVGFQTVRDIVDIFEGHMEPERFAAWQASSYLLYPSSFLAQTASAMDPDMREANTILEGFRYHLPFIRQTLLPKRDPVYGEPVPNPGYMTFGRTAPVNTDPVKAEMDRLKYYPQAPQREIGHVKLNDEQYDRYQATAGPFAKQLLTEEIHKPEYQRLNPDQQVAALKEKLSFARARARIAMHGFYPETLKAGIARRESQITGE